MRRTHSRVKSRIPNLLFFSSLCMLIVLMGSWSKAAEGPSLASFPFVVERTDDPARGAVCPVCKGIYSGGEVAPGAQNILTRELYGKIEALGTFRVIPLEIVEEARSRSVQMRLETNLVRSSVPLGRELNADFIMVAHLFRFEQRVGSSVGVEKPASVAFDLHLIRIRDGARVWDGGFDETQKALFDNLLRAGSFFKEGAKWVTAEELAAVGMDKVLKNIPGAKELEWKP
jgi:hypothetical protein